LVFTYGKETDSVWIFFIGRRPGSLSPREGASEKRNHTGKKRGGMETRALCESGPQGLPVIFRKEQ